MHRIAGCAQLVIRMLVLGTGMVSLCNAQDRDSPLEHQTVMLPVRLLPRDNLLIARQSDGALRAVQTVEDWQLRRKNIADAVEAILGPIPVFDAPVPLDVKVETELDQGTYRAQQISYQSTPGSRVPAWLLIPKSAHQQPGVKLPAVLCLHQTTHLGPLEVIGQGGQPNLWYGRELAERGYVVMAPSYPLLGSYQPDLEADGWKSGTLKAVWDNKRALDLLDELPFVQKKRYAAIGHSLGGHNSVFTAFHDERIQAVVTSCGLDSFVDYYHGNDAVWQPGQGWTQTRYMPRLSQYRGRLQEIPFDFHELIAGLAPRSVLIVAPTSDGNFRMDSVDRIGTAARPVFELSGAPDNLQIEHPDCGHDFPPAMREKAYRLIDSVLK